MPPSTLGHDAIIVTTETKPQADRVAYTIPEFSARFGKKRHWGYTQVRKGKVRVIEGYGEKMIPASEIDRILSGKEDA